MVRIRGSPNRCFRVPTLSYSPGQRWHSLTEPELGLGTVVTVDGRELTVTYPARDVIRRYGVADAPLARARLTEGHEAHGNGVRFRIEEVVHGDVLTYRGEGMELSETDLDAELDVATPENRLRSGQLDDHRNFDLRRHALEVRHHMLLSPARGFLGGKIRLFDHQLSIARDVCDRHRIRVLLADEVGLGKTIEALLILHRMLLSGRVERALVIVPPALVHQWLAEAYHRFNLVLRVIGRDTVGGGTINPESEELPSELLGAQLFVCPLGVPAGRAFVESDWDFLVVDEAHHLESDSADFALIESLAERVDHVLLLSATPDRDGESAHFRRLALLDPARFHDEDGYRHEADNYRELANTSERLHRDEPITDADHALLRDRLASPDLDELLRTVDTDPTARRRLLRRLLDLHGLGRVMFRNVRARIPGFPRRSYVPVPLESDRPDRYRREFLADIGRDDTFRFSNAATDARTIWLRRFLGEIGEDKVLVLCTSRAKVEAFADALENKKREVARFHEEMSSLERDRQAAWFLADDGPQILISAAIGAEGRNFQVARHLVLMDLPLTADRLEQLIGRVDRIGQGEEVLIHVPAVPGTPQERLARWFDRALGVFACPWHGSPAIDREFGDDLIEALLARDDDKIEALLARGKLRNDHIVGELEGGRDRLLELTSFDASAAEALREAIELAEEGPELEEFMVEAFERSGLELEWIGDRSYVVRPGPGYTRPFPGFHGQEMGVTFDRTTGLDQPQRSLLSWDHPMVRDTIDALLSSESGNATLARRTDSPPGLRLEALFVAEPTLPRELRADRFFPPTPIFVVVDGTDSADSDGNVSDSTQNAELTSVDPAILDVPAIASRIPELVESARQIAERRSPALADAARARMREELEPTVRRLEELAAVNHSIRSAEVDAARAEFATLDDRLSHVRVRLDALRLVIVAPG